MSFKKYIITISILTFITVIQGQGCSGGFESASSGGQGTAGPGVTPPSQNSDAFYTSNAFGASEMRRLTRFELGNSLEDIFGVSLGSDITLVPEDITSNTPFDNNYKSQSISPLLVSGYSIFSESYAQRLIGQNNFVQNFANCNPQSYNDSSCFSTFIQKAGRLLFRRPLLASEISGLSNKFLPLALQDENFDTAIELALQYFLINPEFLYKIEGTQNPQQLTEIDNFEIATRMSFMLWGSTPDNSLLLAAEAGELKNESNRAFHARRMLNDPKAQKQWQRFHAMWLGYSEAPLPSALANDLNLETNKLLEKVIFDSDTNWLDIFSSEETYVTPNLASFYNMPNAPNSPSWTPYSGVRGGGILAHGTFLSLGAKFNDTSPTIRGYEIFKRLACGELGPVPPGVDVDTPPGNPNDCKPVRYHMRTTQSCSSCHSIMDNIGFGLENFGVFGKWRDVEPSNPSCAIDNSGNWFGKTYTGPKSLGKLISEDQQVVDCSSKQLFRFLMGRKEASADSGTIGALNAIRQQNPNLKRILEEFIKSPAIKYKKEQ